MQKRGAIHYHVIFFSLPFVPYTELKKLWTSGSVNIKKIKVDYPENIGRYISKYFEKSLNDTELLLKYMNKKRIFKSKNLKKPYISYEINNEYKKFDSSDVLFQKEYKRYKKIGEDFIEETVRYTKVKNGDDNNDAESNK